MVRVKSGHSSQHTAVTNINVLYAEYQRENYTYASVKAEIVPILNKDYRFKKRLLFNLGGKLYLGKKGT